MKLKIKTKRLIGKLKTLRLYFVRRSFFIEDMKKAYRAGGDIKTWSDYGIEPRYKNFEDWYRQNYA